MSGSDVVVVMHSYGGVPGMECMKYFQQGHEKKKEGRGKIFRMVWVCSFVLRVGGDLMEGCGGKDLIWWDIDVSFIVLFVQNFSCVNMRTN